MAKKVTVNEEEVNVKDWGEFWALVKEAKGHVTLKDENVEIDVTREKKVMVQAKRLWYKAFLDYRIDQNLDDIYSDIYKILGDVEVETPYWHSIQIHKRDGIYYVIVVYKIDDDVEFTVHYVSLMESLDINNISSLTKPVDKIVKDLKRYFERW